MPTPAPAVRSLLRLLPVLLALSAGCRSVSVDEEHDPSADFSRYKTFGWLSVPPAAKTAVSDASLTDLIARELTAHGMQQSTGDADLMIAVHRSIEGNLNTSGWGYERTGGQVQHYTYQEGSLVVDLVDPKIHRSVWRGTASGAFKFSTDPAEKQKMLSGFLHEMFADFPPKK
jgi:hypothetical protein